MKGNWCPGEFVFNLQTVYKEVLRVEPRRKVTSLRVYKSWRSAGGMRRAVDIVGIVQWRELTKRPKIETVSTDLLML